MTLRVLHILNDLRGGASYSAIELMKEALRANSAIRHYAVYPLISKQYEERLRDVAEGWASVPIRTWDKKNLRTGREIASWLKAQWQTRAGRGTRRQLARLVDLWQIDVIHTNTAIIADGARFALSEGLPHVWHIRERLGKGGFKQLVVPDGEAAAFISQSSNAIPVISRYVRGFFVENGVAEKTHLVYDGIDFVRLERDKVLEHGATFRKSLGIPEGAKIVSMVGGFWTDVKRQDLFLECARMLTDHFPDAVFLVIGASLAQRRSLGATKADKYAEATKRWLRKNGMMRRVLFPGYVEDMAAVWGLTDVYVHLCEVEGFSRAILEAMAAGVPVVAADAGGNMEAIENDETGLLLPPGDVRAFAEAIGFLLENPSKRRDLAKQAMMAARSRFGVAEHYRVMARVFSNAVSQE